ncbi:tRNA dihydrouridine synthase DusB [Candidatus Izemoplasma sp. B36]|uniref:tRNA dihydrouridine synthase DusB n=1 Tax=Candidatus Izemoplasma sp. B36 TaxID=3242468 RepID=UPI0035567712
MKWKIKGLEINNQVLVAPMAGVTNIAYRSILKEFGAGLICTEMISDKGLLYENNKTKDMIEISEFEKPISLQLFGSDVETITKAAVYIDENSQCDVIDINMGCPVNKVIKTGAGSKLMTTPLLAYDMVKSIVDKVKKPVTVKIRSGFTHKDKNAVEFAKLMEKAGANMIAVHGRTRSDMYTGKADLDIIKAVKEAVTVPVVGNGDIRTPEDAKYMLDYTGCDAVMIGRGVLGNPFLIKQIVDYLETGEYEQEISLETRKSYIIKHLDRLIELKGEKVAVLEMRSHGAWYIKGLKGASKVKNKIVLAKTVNEIIKIINDYFDSLK